MYKIIGIHKFQIDITSLWSSFHIPHERKTANCQLLYPASAYMPILDNSKFVNGKKTSFIHEFGDSRIFFFPSLEYVSVFVYLRIEVSFCLKL